MMNKKMVTLLTLILCIPSVYPCNHKEYTLIPNTDLEQAKTPPYAPEHELVISSESEDNPTVNSTYPMYVRRAPLSRHELIWRVTKYTLCSLVGAGIGIGSYFLAENIMHEEDIVNNYLHGINQSLTEITNDIELLTNLTLRILGKL